MATTIPILKNQVALATVTTPVAVATTGTTYRVRAAVSDDVSADGQLFAVIYRMLTTITTGNLTVKVQGSPDGSTWYDLGDATVSHSTSVAAELVWDQDYLPLYIRAYMSTAGTHYSGAVYLCSNGQFELVAV